MIGNSYGNPFLVIDIDFSTWASLACAVANRNFSEAEWGRYLGGIPYRSTCQ